MAEDYRLVQAMIDFYKNIHFVDPDELAERGIEFDNLCGAFFPHNGHKALAVCKKFPEYHIVSHMKDWDYNRYLPGALSYSIASGDPDPSLKVFIPPPTQETWKRKLKILIELVGPNPEDPEDRFEIRLLTMLAYGADMKDPTLVKKARER